MRDMPKIWEWKCPVCDEVRQVGFTQTVDDIGSFPNRFFPVKAKGPMYAHFSCGHSMQVDHFSVNTENDLVDVEFK